MKNYLVRNNRNNGYDFWDDAFDNFFRPAFYEGKRGEMKTDIKENENEYVMEVEAAGFDKKDINLSLENGYLTITASKKECEKDCNDKTDCKKENYIRRERSCSLSRSFYVGDVKKEDVKAKYENGILTVEIPKEKPAVPVSHNIEIE